MDKKQDLIKRVIGLPGETIRIHDGSVTINGQVLEEPYIAQSPIYNGEWMIGEGQLFVLGDNRTASGDSRCSREEGCTGLVPLDAVIGTALLRVWPPGRFGWG